MGKRQIGELEVGELVCTLLISEIVSIPIDTPEVPLLNAIIPMVFIVSLEIILSFIKNKSQKIKRIVEGSPSFVIREGTLVQEELKRNRISINEVLSEMRMQGYADIKEVRYCVLESGGKLSFFKFGTDLSLPLVIDGEFEEDNLALFGIEKSTVIGRLKKGKEIRDVFLLSATSKESYNIIYKEEKNERKTR